MNNSPRYFVGEDVIIDLDKVALAYKGKATLGRELTPYVAIHLYGAGNDYSYKLWRAEALDFWKLYSEWAQKVTCPFNE